MTPPFFPPRDWPIPPMDHGSGGKDTAFTWAMGDLILRRMGYRETMRQITADPRMPAYCTVFRWVKVVPEFGEAYRRLRGLLAQAQQAEAAQLRAVKAEARDGARLAAGKRVRHWVSGPRSSYTPVWGETVCEAIADGASLSEVVGWPGMPSSKAVYAWMRRFPEFKAAYVKACEWRAAGLEAQIEQVADMSTPWTLAADRAEVAMLEGRIGRLTPKIYRA